MVHGTVSQYVLLQFPRVFSDKWHNPHQYAVQKYPQDPYANLGAVIGLTPQDLWDHIEEDATEGAQFVVVKFPTKAKVCYFSVQLTIYKYVL